MITLFVVLISLALLCLAVFAFRFLTIERRDAESPAAEVSSEPAAEDAAHADEAAEETAPEEMVNLVDYFKENTVGMSGNEKKPAPANHSFPETDPHTDLKVGRNYFSDCEKLLANAKQSGLVYCAAYFDFDRFSFINSLRGAATGDYVLAQTGREVRRIFPESALCTRISCDHFVVLFPLADLAALDDYAESLARFCEKVRGDIGAKASLRIALGFATVERDEDYSIGTLTAKANIARHCVKIAKAERFEVYNDSMITSNFYGESLLDLYGECQYGDEFSIFYAPISDISAQRIVAGEALVRWACEVTPDMLVTPDNGRIPSNNAKIMYQSCRAMSRWRKAGRAPIPLLVNIPEVDLFIGDIDDFVGKCLVEFQLEPDEFCAEIDASIIGVDWTMCAKQLKKLHNIGAKICISNIAPNCRDLSYLSDLDIDYVKLPPSFAHQADQDPDQLERCRRTVTQVTALKAQAIFEGVDSPDLAQALKSVGVRLVQGRFAGRAVLSDDFGKTLPEYIARRSDTVILDDSALAKGEFTIY